jgi:hypothetical protein
MTDISSDSTGGRSGDKPWLITKGGRANGHGTPMGRPKGTANKISARIKEAVLEAVSLEGEVSIQPKDVATMLAETEEETAKRGGLVGYFRWLARNEPVVVGHILAKIMPTQVNVSAFNEDVYHSVEQVREEMIREGVSFDAVVAVIEDVEYRELTPHEAAPAQDSDE